MSVTEIIQSIGSWTLRLREDTPVSLLDQLTFYGHIAILPGQVEPAQYDDNLLSSARYVGVYRTRSAQDAFTLSGSGMAFWLGDEDDKGDVFETAVNLVGTTFANSVRALLPPGGAVTEGLLLSVPGTYTGKHQWQTPRFAIQYITDIFGAEWRVNNNATLDAGLASDLYVFTPKTLVLRKGGYGADLQRKAIPGQTAMDTTLEEFTSRVVLLAEGEGTSIATGSANAILNPYKDLHGNALKATRLVSESGTTAGNAIGRAQMLLNRYLDPGRSVSLSASEYDIKGTFVVGDALDVYDPENGFYDANREIYWQGEHINPMSLRCVEMTWPIPPGWTVAFRDINGNWIDLSKYYIGESGDTSVVVGKLRQGLARTGSEPVGVRPNLPDSDNAPDATIPAAPAFTGFSTGSYESDDRTLAAIYMQWAQPLNSDGSVILDGDHYEIHHRPNQVIGAPVPWDLLSDYQDILVDDFNRAAISSGWGTPWTSSGGVGTDYFTDGTSGKISLSVLNSSRRITVAGTYLNAVHTVKFTVPNVGQGDDIETSLMCRGVDGSNYLQASIFWDGDSTFAELRIIERVAGVATSRLLPNGNAHDGIALTLPFTQAQAGLTAYLRCSVYGDIIEAQVWSDKAGLEAVSTAVQSTAFSSAGFWGVRGNLQPGYTGPMPVVIAADDYHLMSLDPGPAAYSWDDLGTWDSALIDDFNRTSASGWLNGWTFSGGVGTDYPVSPNAAKQLLAVTNSSRRSVFGSGLPDDQQMVVCRKFDVMAVGGNMESSPMLRYGANPADPDYYYYEVEWSYTSASLRARIMRRKNGSDTALSTAFDIPGLTYSAGTMVWTLAQAVGDYHQMKVWTGLRTDEPNNWTVSVRDVNASTFVNGGKMGVRSLLDPLNSNPSPVTCTYTYVEAKVFSPQVTWDALTSIPVVATPNWTTAYVGWDQTAFTLTELGVGVQYELQVRAVDTSANVSPWSVSSFVQTSGDAIAPSAPAAPEVAASLIAVQIVHALGKSSGGVFNLELDLHHLEVHASSSTSYYPDETTKVGEMVATGAMIRGNIPAVGSFKVNEPGTTWIRIVAVDRTGNKSAPSDAVQSSVELIDSAHISDLSVTKLTAGTITAQSVLAAEMEIGAGGNIRITDGSLDAYDSFGNKRIEVGQLADGTFDLAAFDPDTGAQVNLAQLAFGMNAAKEGSSTDVVGQVGGSPVYVAAPDGYGPMVTGVRVGASKRCLVILSCNISYNYPQTVDARTGKFSYRIIDETTGLVTYEGSDGSAFAWDTDGTSAFIHASRANFIPKGFSAFPTLNGTYTFEARYQVMAFNSERLWFSDREIIVMPF